MNAHDPNIIDLAAYDPQIARMARLKETYEDDQREHIKRQIDRIDASLQSIEGCFRRLIASGADISDSAKDVKAAGLSIQLVAELMAYAAKQERV